jgi:hypothetical protein
VFSTAGLGACAQAFLCGIDPLSGNNFEHHRDWLHQLEQQLA